MRIRALTGPVVLGALFATTPQLAVGQPKGVEESPAEITLNVRPGTEIQADQLGEFLAKNITVSYPTLGRGVEVPNLKILFEFISREEGVIGKSESEAEFVTDKPGEILFDLKRGIPIPRRFTYGGRGRLTFGNFGTFEARPMAATGFEDWIPRECEGATHAVRITLASDDGRVANIDLQNKLICLNVEG